MLLEVEREGEDFYEVVAWVYEASSSFKGWTYRVTPQLENPTTSSVQVSLSRADARLADLVQAFHFPLLFGSAGMDPSGPYISYQRTGGYVGTAGCEVCRGE